MSVTIHSSPQDYSHSGNPFVWVFSSDQTAQANFSYKVEVSIDALLQETHLILPEAGIRSHFDASDIAERYCNIPSIAGGDVVDALNNIQVKIEVIENYGTPPSDQLSATNTRTAFKGKLSKQNFLNWTPSDYLFAASSLWMTLFPRTEKRYVELSVGTKLMFMTNGLTLVNGMELFDSAGISIQAIDSTNKVRARISITNITNSVLLTDFGFTQVQIDQAAYIETWWYDGASFSERYRVYIDDRCASTSAQDVLFLSSLGSLEHIKYIKRAKESGKIKGKGFEQQFGQFDDSLDWVYSLGGVTDYIKIVENMIEVQTDFISEDEYRWLAKESLTAPLVYLMIGATYYRVRIKASKYKFKTSENDMVFNLSTMIQIDTDSSTVI